MKNNGIIIASPSSGSGKTTISLGIMLALKERGYSVQPFKVGPDYIDPGYHTYVTGKKSENLDTWMGSENTVKDIFTKRSTGSDIAVIEGVMGLFDGRSEKSIRGSTAEIAKILKLPVIIVLDISSMGRTSAAIINGLKDMGNDIKIAGVILNRAGSNYHCSIAKHSIETLSGIRVIGCIKKDDKLKLNSRHLGLIPFIEEYHSKEFLSYLSGKINSDINMDQLINISRKTASLNYRLKEHKSRNTHVTIGVAYDKAFNFYYNENFDLLKKYGAKIEYFSPMDSNELPDIDGIYIGGGFPEIYAEKLSSNKKFLYDIKSKILSGMPVFAECGGYMYLSKTIEMDNKKYDMLGLINASVTLKGLTLGYRNIVSRDDNILFKKGMKIRGHEFHYSTIRYDNENEYAYDVNVNAYDGYYNENILAGYSHLYFPSNKKIPERFVKSCYIYSKR